MSVSRWLVLVSVAIAPALAADAPAPAVPVASHGAAVGPRSTSALAHALVAGEQEPLYGAARVGVQVVNVRTGEEIYAHGDDAGMMPASVAKVLTSAVALRELGPSHRIPTWVLADGDLGRDGVLAGNLYLKGQGDPTMMVERLWRLAFDLRLRGIREIRGDLVLDAGYFEGGASLIPGWNNKDDLANPPTYFPMLGALSVNQNLATITVRPGVAVGQPALSEVEIPFAGVTLENEVRTGTRSSRPWLKVDRRTDETGKLVTFRVTGSLPLDGAAETFYRPVADPLGQYAAALTTVMEQHGIRLRGAWRPGATPTGARLVMRSESVPLAEIVSQTQKHSNNFYAEQLLRIVGAERRGLPGTTEKGVDVASAYLASLGIPRGEFTVANGSGLSRETRLRPSHVNAVLIDMARNPDCGAEFLAGLSVAGRDGTLWSRFRDESMEGRVRGKTGTLAGVSTLAGYVRGADDELYAFTFLANDIQGVPGRARRAHDRLVTTLAGVAPSAPDALAAEGGSGTGAAALP